jgi:VIT1/CCC1 family predicted Fe2+/Mn2+ transporter
MGNLTASERAALLGAARRVHTYKLMQARGYARLATRAQDQGAKRVLTAISTGEAQDSEHWDEHVSALEARPENPPSPFLARLKIPVMMGILGTRGFFEWAIIAEDESVEDLAVLAGNLTDRSAAASWSRMATDERLHIERVKKQVLGMEGWEMGGGGGVRDVIFGANDGLVSILALLAGVYGAATGSHLILISGAAGAVAGAVSMGAGAYVSSKSEQEVTARESRRKGIRGRGTRDEQREELLQFYLAQGFGRGEAEAVAARVTARRDPSGDYPVSEDLGLLSEGSWPPVKAAVLTGLSFAIASLVPILPFAFLSVTPAAVTAAIASIGALFAVGASKAVFTRKSYVKSGAEMMVIGTLAAAVTYAIGLLFPEG